MEENSSPEEILKKIKESKKILIPLHRGPDGDSLGSCAAVKYWLERDFNKEVKLVSYHELIGMLKEFDFAKEIEFGKGVEDFNSKEFDLFLFLDHSVPNYTVSELEINFPKGSVINIDHHETNSFFGDLNYVDEKRPSCCSVLIDLFKEWKVKFDKELSTRLLVGIYSDSAGFTHDKGDSLRDAVFLIDKGADYLEGVVNIIRYNVPLKLKRYNSLVVDKFKIINFEGYKVGISCVSKEEMKDLDLNPSEVRSAPGYLQEIEGIDMLFTLTETEDHIKGSFRSRKKINVSLFAKELGGGGHKFAAAFRFEKISLEEAEKKVLEAIKKVGIHKVEE